MDLAAMKLREHSESKILRELERTRVALDELEVIAQARRAYAATVTIHAARDLADYIEKLRRAPRNAFGFASLKVSREVESARRQLRVWIARLLATLRGSPPVAG
jgi:hypothetical protein